MLLSRFWYVVLALVLGGAYFVLSLAVSMYNRTAARVIGEGLSADSQVVGWYLKDDARARSGHLIKFALDRDLAQKLKESSASEGKVPNNAREKVREALVRVNQTIPQDQAFDAVFAVDQLGRVVAHLGYEQMSGSEDFELGGYPVVADGLHGFVRDDTLLLDRLYRVVARPVEYDLGQMPAGAIVGVRILDDRFARELSQRTGAAVAFYANGQRVSSGAPEGFDVSQLDQIVGDLKDLESDPEYQQKGRSKVRIIGKLLGVQYTRLHGEAWKLGSGYVVGRLPNQVEGPLGFFSKADDKDKDEANLVLTILVALLVGGVGLGFTVIEHTGPLHKFRLEAARLAKGESDQLVPSKFRGVYRKIASDLNDGIDHLAAKGGAPRRAADLKEVLGDLPDQPQMSAFSFPGDQMPSAPLSEPRSLPKAPGRGSGRPKPPSPRQNLEMTMPEGGAIPGVTDGDEGLDEESEWRQVFEEFVALKQQCGENTEGFTYEKFEQTLRKNRDGLVSRHGAKRVKFSVYVKDGKAALKANPLKD